MPQALFATCSTVDQHQGSPGQAGSRDAALGNRAAPYQEHAKGSAHVFATQVQDSLPESSCPAGRIRVQVVETDLGIGVESKLLRHLGTLLRQTMVAEKVIVVEFT